MGPDLQRARWGVGWAQWAGVAAELSCPHPCCAPRTESVAEKMLTNWFTFLLYKFLKVGGCRGGGDV